MHHVLSNCWYLSTKLLSVTSHKTNLHVEAKYFLISIVTVSFSGKILYMKIACHSLSSSEKLGLRGRSLLTACSVVYRDV